MTLALGRTMLVQEREAGRRADFHVLYTRSGLRYVDPIWAEAEAEARSKFLALTKELRWKNVVIKRMVPVETDG